MTQLTWQAEYKDGTVIKQFDTGRIPAEVSSEVLDRNRIKSFSIMRGSEPVLTLHLNEGQRLVYRRRTSITGGYAFTGSMKKMVCHLVGWQQTVKGENVQSIAYVFEDGRIELAGKFREEHSWFYSPQFLKSELEHG